MKLLTTAGAALAWIGRRGAKGFAASIFLGLALPDLAETARPFLPVTIFCFTVIVFLRADFAVIGRLIARPCRLILACLWLWLGPILLVGALVAAFGRGAIDPGLLLGLAVLAAAPPIMSSPAVAILYGFEPSLIIASVVIATIAAPITAPFVADLIVGAAAPLDRATLALRLAAFIGGGAAVALVLRRVIGPARVAAAKASFDGAGVVLYFIFAIAAMDGVTRAAIERPGIVALFLAVAFGLAAAGLIMGWTLLRFLGATDRFMLGYGSGQRNMGLLVAALGAGVPETTYLFFALAQFPIYLGPMLLKPFASGLTPALPDPAEKATAPL